MVPDCCQQRYPILSHRPDFMPSFFRATRSRDKGIQPPAHSNTLLSSSSLYRMRIGLHPRTLARVTILDGPSPVAISDAGINVNKKQTNIPINRAMTRVGEKDCVLLSDTMCPLILFNGVVLAAA